MLEEFSTGLHRSEDDSLKEEDEVVKRMGGGDMMMKMMPLVVWEVETKWRRRGPLMGCRAIERDRELEE